MTARIIRGNALALPLADDMVDLVVTSPPYFGLRSYQDGGEHYSGQIGSEATPAEFVDALLAATREMVRVVKPSGSIWVNLGDKYSQRVAMRPSSHQDGLQPDRPGVAKDWKASKERGEARMPYQNITDPETGRYVPEKSLIGIPWRYALRCIDDLGLILRAEVIWSKPNGLPESVTDRVRRSHETWFHFTRSPRYFSAVDEIRESHAEVSKRIEAGAARKPGGYAPLQRAKEVMPGRAGETPQNGRPLNPLGKLPGSVWTINEGESLVRSVLNAVATQGITADEGERILLWTARDSGRAQPNRQTDAGNGSAPSRQTATAATTPSTKGPAQPTESPTSSLSDPSQTGSPSTTPAETGHASTPTTSSPSQSRSTSPDDPSRTSVHTDTTTTSATPTSGPTASESAGSAWQSGRDGREQPSGPPSVWVVPTQPLTVPPELGVDHFAAFPMEWPRRIIQGWSPAGVCTACGEGRRPVGTLPAKSPKQLGAALKAAREGLGLSRGDLARRAGCGTNNVWDYEEGGHIPRGAAWTALADALSLSMTREEFTGEREYSQGVESLGKWHESGDNHATRGNLSSRSSRHVAITGYACACPDTTAPTTPAVILDPFGGTGTTALVAKALGRTGISVDMSADYCRLAQWRTTDPGELARAMQVEKPAKQIEGQISMLDLLDEEGGAA